MGILKPLSQVRKLMFSSYLLNSQLMESSPLHERLRPATQLQGAAGGEGRGGGGHHALFCTLVPDSLPHHQE